MHWTAFSLAERGVVLDCYFEKDAISITILSSRIINGGIFQNLSEFAEKGGWGRLARTWDEAAR